MTVHEAVVKLKASLQWRCALRSGVWWAVVGLLVWGSVILVLRLVWPVSWWLHLVGGLLVVGAAVAGAIWALRNLPQEAQLSALLDAENQCGGILMSSWETCLDSWTQGVEVRRIPQVSWKKRKALALLAVSAVYVAVALLVPQRYLRPVQAESVAAEREVEKLEQQLEKLRELGLVESPRYEELQAELQQVRKNASAQEPGNTQEAIDHLEQALKQLALDALQKRAEERELLEQAREFAGVLREMMQSGQIKPNQAERVSQALEQLLQEAMNAKPGDKAEALKKWLEEHGNDGLFTEKELDDLTDLLEQWLKEQGLNWEDLAEVGLIDPEWLKRLKRLEIDPERLKNLRIELVRLIEGEGSDLDPEEFLLLLARCRGRCGSSNEGDGLPGRGGVTRGRADAELTFGKPSSPEGVQFRPEVLKPGALHNLDTLLVQVRKVKPGTEQRQESQGGALTESGGVGEGHQRQILPRHRPAVRRYFESGR